MTEVDKSRSPYFDDYNRDDNYYEMLFRPRRAVQTRELNQVQTMFYEQVKRFGEHIFEDGSVVIPGESNYDLELSYVTANINNISSVIDVLSSDGVELKSSNGVSARVKLFREESGGDPSTFYIEYLNSSDDALTTKFQAGETIDIIFNGNTITNANVIGEGVASKFTINNGVYYIKGRFVLIERETVLLDKYSNTPSKIVCIIYDEEVVTETDDDSLFDNAQGAPNFSAPGAHRLRVNTKLDVFDLADIDTIPDNAVEIFRIDEGEIQRKYRGPEYNILEDVLAQRTFEESGDYTVKPFKIGFAEYGTVFENTDEDKFVTQLDPGIAYVKGFRVESLSKINIESNKARATGILNNSSISAGLGYYINVDNLSTIPDINTYQEIEFQDTAVTTPGNNPGGSVLGTARVRLIGDNEDGSYRLYLFDVKNASGNRSTGFIGNVQSVFSSSSTTFTAGVSDPTIQESGNNSLVFPTNVEFAKSLKNQSGISDTSFSTVKQFNETTDANGVVVLTAPTNEIFILQDPRYAVTIFTDTNQYYDISGDVTLGGNPNGSIITIDFGNGNSGRPVRFSLQVAKEQVVQRVKTPTTNSVVGSFSNGQLSLNRADVYQIDSVTDNNGVDVTDQIQLFTNKTRSFYGVSYVETNVTTAQPITVNYTYFAHSSGDYFGPDSYDDLDYEDIPSENGVRLSDVLDFRPRLANDGQDFTGAGSNKGDIPTPYTIIRSDIEHYLPRKDKVYVKSNGNFGVVEGVPSLDPKEPADPSDSMILYNLDVPAYTFLLDDIQAIKENNRRYTMKDIGIIENRLSNVEYYTSLNLLEQEAESQQVIDPITGNNRFKNGFLTDQFVDHSVGDFTWSGYHVSMEDEGEMRPEFSLNAVDLEENLSASSNVVINDGIVTLPYEHVSFIKQGLRSRTLNVNPYAIYRWSAEITLNPSVDSWIDTRYTLPDVTYRLFNNGRLTQTWNSWFLFWSGGTRTSSSSSRNVTRNIGFTQTTSRITNTRTVRTNIDVVNDRLVDTSVIPFMRSITVRVDGKGNRPNSRMYFFFDDKDVNAYVRPSGGSDGQPVITDQQGEFTAYYRIPNNFALRFRTGEKKLVVIDDENNLRENSTSYGDATFTSSGIRNTRQRTIVATRSTTTSSSSRVISRRRLWRDPLAQSFLVERDGGVFLTKVKVFFETKDTITPVSVEIREMENGSPTQRIIPGGVKMLNPSEVNTSDDGSVATEFVFNHPVYLANGNEYCFVVMSNSNAYNAFIATMGERDLGTNKFVVEQPYAGVLFKSQNNSTWTADQNSDLQFELEIADFDISSPGILIANNASLDDIDLEQNPIRTENGTNNLYITSNLHNYPTGATVTISGAAGGNGLTAGDINGDFVVEDVPSPNEFLVRMSQGALANSSGDIGGTDVSLSNVIQASVLAPNIPTIQLPNTNLILEARGTVGQSIDGNEGLYTLITDYTELSNNENNTIDTPWIVTSDNDESINLSGNKSLEFRGTFVSTRSNISPVIDLQGANIVMPFAAITNPAVDDADSIGNWANYRTGINVLNDPADLMKVFMDINSPQSSKVLVSARFGNSEDEIEEADWFFIPNVSSERTTLEDRFYENEFEKTGIDQFTHYQILIQLKSDSSVNFPVCRRLRVIALSDFL